MPNVSPARRIDLLGLPIDDLTMSETLDFIDRLIAAGPGHQHVVVNVSKVVQASRDPALRDIVRNCDLVSVDGQPIIWASRLLGHPLRERVTGIDLMLHLFQRAEECGYTVYLLGARHDVLQSALRRLKRDFPRLIVAGARDGYFGADEELGVVRDIARRAPDILMVAMSSPAKERFLARWRHDLGVPFMMGVGGSFDVYAGLTRRAPLWMQRAGMEWAFRVAQEPRRMWRRYAGDAPRFAWLVFRSWKGRHAGK